MSCLTNQWVWGLTYKLWTRNYFRCVGDLNTGRLLKVSPHYYWQLPYTWTDVIYLSINALHCIYSSNSWDIHLGRIIHTWQRSTRIGRSIRWASKDFPCSPSVGIPTGPDFILYLWVVTVLQRQGSTTNGNLHEDYEVSQSEKDVEIYNF